MHFGMVAARSPHPKPCVPTTHIQRQRLKPGVLYRVATELSARDLNRCTQRQA